MIETIKKSIEEFDEKFIPENISRFKDRIDVNELGIPMIPKEVKDFIITSHISLLTKMKEELEGEISTESIKINTRVGKDPFDGETITIPIEHEDTRKLARKATIYDQISKIDTLLEEYKK
jgi:hypothetical protein